MQTRTAGFRGNRPVAAGIFGHLIFFLSQGSSIAKVDDLYLFAEGAYT